MTFILAHMDLRYMPTILIKIVTFIYFIFQQVMTCVFILHQPAIVFVMITEVFADENWLNYGCIHL